MNDKSKPQDVDWSEIEIYRIEFDYLKQLTTICTGSILLVVAFLEKLFCKPQWKYCVAVSLISFMISIVLCAISQALIIEKVSERKNLSHRTSMQNWTIGLLLLALLAYVIGIFFLGVFGLKNLM